MNDCLFGNDHCTVDHPCISCERESASAELHECARCGSFTRAGSRFCFSCQDDLIYGDLTMGADGKLYRAPITNAEMERESHDVAYIVAIRPINPLTPNRVIFELWHDQPFSPCVEPSEVKA